MDEFHTSKRKEWDRLAYLGVHAFEYTHTNKKGKSFRLACKNNKIIVDFINFILSVVSILIDRCFSWATPKRRVVIKMVPIGTRTQNCFSQIRRSAGLSIPGRDTYWCRAVYLFVHCSHFIALSMQFHYKTYRQLDADTSRSLVVWMRRQIFHIIY